MTTDFGQIKTLADYATVQLHTALARKPAPWDDLLRPEQIEGGWRVRTTDSFHVDVMRMAAGNLRIVETLRARPFEYLRGWCYHAPLYEVVLRCGTFDPEDRGSEPAGWVKEVGTERRACAGYFRGPRLHEAFDAECLYCGDERLR